MSDADARLDRLAEELVAGLRAGETADVERWARAHPDLAERIRELFPVLVALEGARARPPAPGPRPTVLDGHRVLREIGRGGMGVVYEALTPEGRRVALKVVHPHLADEPGLRARFLREAEAGRRVVHPGVVRTLGAGLHAEAGQETPYLVLELVDGLTLRRLLEQRGSVSERLAREIGLGVAEALAAVHAAGIVHRDVKPENVALLPDETVKLMDLGVATLGEEAQQLTRTGQFVGSLLYAAPEQLEGRAVDARADLHALGTLLFELLAGRHPAARPGERVPRFPAGPRPAPSLVPFAPHVSPFLAAVVQRLLAREPAERFESARVLAEVLRQGERSPWWSAQRHQARGARGEASPTPFLGREAELAVLEGAADRVRRGGGSALLVTGPAGVGKSRLLAAWLDARAGAGEEGTTLIARHGAGTDERGRAPLEQALAAHLGPDDLAEQHRERLGPLEGMVRDLQRTLRGEPGASLTGDGRRTALLALLRALAADAPLTLVLEDLHVASPEERSFYGRLVRALGSSPVLVLLTTRETRPEPDLADLGARGLLERLDLQPLEPEVAGRLASHLLGAGTPPEEVGALARRSGGNPLFLLELARAARAAAPGPSRTPPGGPGALPDSLRGLIESRLTALEGEQRHLLEAAACAGSPFDPRLVLEALDVPRLGGLQAFHAIERRHGLLRPLGPDYVFQHPLVEEVVRDGLPGPLRAACHAALGSALEARARGAGPSRPTALPLAQHFLKGDAPERSVPYLDAALDERYDAQELRALATLAEAALALGGALPPALRVKALRLLGMAELAFRPAESAREHLAKALTESLDAGLEREAVQCGHSLGYVERLLGRRDEALRLQREAVERAERLGDVRLLATCLGALAVTLAVAGRREEARATAVRALERARAAGDGPTICDTARHLGEIEQDAGNLEEARRHLEMSVAVARLHGSRITEASALTVLSKLAFLEARPADAAGLLGDVLVIAREVGHARMEAVVEANRALALLALGRATEAWQAAEGCVALATRMGYADVALHGRLMRGRVAWAVGRLGDALRDLRACAQEARSVAPAQQAQALLGIAAPAAWVGAFEEAEQGLSCTREALAAGSGRQGSRWVAAQAEVALARGDVEEAERLLSPSALQAGQQALGQEELEASLSLGLVRLVSGRPAKAVAPLERALALAQAGALVPWTGAALALLGLARGGDPLTLLDAFERDAALAPALLRHSVAKLLAYASGDPRAHERVASAADRLLATLDPADAARARERVPLWR